MQDFQGYWLRPESIDYFGFELKTPIAQTGADVETVFHVPFSHTLKEMHLKHTDSVGAESSDSMNIAVYREMYGSWQKIWGRDGLVASNITMEEMDYKSPERRYKIVSNTTSGDQLEIKMLVTYNYMI